MKAELSEKLGEFQDELGKLKTAVDEIEKAGKISSESISLVEKVTESFKKIVDPVQELIVKIEKIDFPRRFDELFRAILSINDSIANLKDSISNLRTELLIKIDNEHNETRNSFIALIEKQNSEIKLLKIVNISTLVLVLVLAVVVIVK